MAALAAFVGQAAAGQAVPAPSAGLSPSAPSSPIPAAPAPVFPTAAKPLGYVCYSPYRTGQAPGGASPTEAQIRQDLALIAPYARGIRTYGASGILARVPDLAREAGLEVYAGAWIGTDEAANLAEVDALAALARSGNPALKGLVVGNEVLLRGDVPRERLAGYIRRAREAGTGVPGTPGISIGTADVYATLIDAAPGLAADLDFVLCHVHPYWENAAALTAAARVAESWGKVTAAFPGKAVLVGETGFPTAGEARGAAVPGEGAQGDLLLGLARTAADQGMPVIWFEAFDEAWKTAEGSAGPHWGLWNADRSEKPALARLRNAVALALPKRRTGRTGAGFEGDGRGGNGSPVLSIDAAGRLGISGVGAGSIPRFPLR